MQPPLLLVELIWWYKSMRIFCIGLDISLTLRVSFWFVLPQKLSHHYGSVLTTSFGIRITSLAFARYTRKNQSIPFCSILFSHRDFFVTAPPGPSKHLFCFVWGISALISPLFSLWLLPTLVLFIYHRLSFLAYHFSISFRDTLITPPKNEWDEGCGPVAVWSRCYGILAT